MPASEQGHLSVLQLLLDKRADVNAKDEKDRTALTFASQERHSMIAEFLKERGAK